MIEQGERELLSRCARGDGAAWAELVAQHDRRILLVLLRTLGRACEHELPDLRQEVYARLLARDGAALRSLRAERPGALAAFLAQVALRVAIDHARARGARPALQLDEAAAAQLPDGRRSPEEETAAREARARLSSAMERACEGPNAGRDLMVLRAHFDDGLAPGEIAALGCGLGVKGVESLLWRGRKRIEELLAEPAQRSEAG